MVSPCFLKIRFLCIARAITSLLCILAPISAVSAQQELREGSFHIHLRIDPITDEDRSIAFLMPNGDAAEGMVAWACGSAEVGLIVGVRLDGYSRTDATRRVIWRFDREKPDTTFLLGANGGHMWFLRDEDIASFTMRAKAATRVVIRDLGEVPGSLGTDYFYNLSGSTSALNRLHCARNPQLLGRPVQRTTVDTVVGSPPAVTDETYELSDVEELPRPTNGAEFARLLAASYPSLLRDAGVTGSVQVRFRVLETGFVDANSITVTSSSHEQFNDPAIRAVQTLRFRPARINGRSVRVWVEQPVAFLIQRE